MIRLLLADDHEDIRFGVQMLLGGEPDITVIGVAAEGSAAVAMAVASRPDVVLMDLSMPVLDGVAATREIMRATPSARVLVHTAYGHEPIIREAFAAGASGCLLDEALPNTLSEAIRAVHRGETPMVPVARDALCV
jgi:DNA-binding NarL/FixJ family response regulator